MAEAAEHMAADVPPRGWAARENGPGVGAGPGEEIAALAAMLQALRDLVPPELQHQLSDVIRQVLVLLRALIDFWIARLEAQPGAEPEVEDIPIT